MCKFYPRIFFLKFSKNKTYKTINTLTVIKKGNSAYHGNTVRIWKNVSGRIRKYYQLALSIGHMFYFLLVI